MRGIDEWFTGDDESMVAGVGEGARGGARRRAASSSAGRRGMRGDLWPRWIRRDGPRRQSTLVIGVLDLK